MQDGRWTTRPCDWSRVEALAEALGVSETTATVLVRRGLDDPNAARAFLEHAPPRHDPFLLGDMEQAVERIRAAVAAGERICVHGDYDVDGISATAVAVLVLRELGARVEWRLPSRFDEGYGLAAETIEQLAADGVHLVLTVDCGITAVEEVARAKELGLDVIVTDHHRPGAALPACPVVATRPSSYPCADLCGTGVVHTLGRALLGDDDPALGRMLDLVALATIADVVPLVDENRALAAAGLRSLARTRRPGLQALMQSAKVDPAVVDSTAVGFRLAPRINAAGRLGRPDVALQLLLTDDRGEADRLAAELEDLNRERQGVEEKIVREATARVDAMSPEERRRRGYVLWDEAWHEGVIGIVASRLVERFHRPVVLVARSGDGWKGSGRSVSDFDLHGGLAACAEHLQRFGGHRAAAGLSIATEQLEAFADAFAAHADATLAELDLRPTTTIDAVVAAGDLTLELAQELDGLAPFGLGNPEPTLLVASVEATGAATVGEGKHLRFRIKQQDRDGGSAIAFGLGGELERLMGAPRLDVAFRLQENRWNGTIAPQLVVRRLFAAAVAYDAVRTRLAGEWRAGEGAWSAEARRVFEELGLTAGGARRELYESPSFRALLNLDAVALPLAA
ncbi:MAG: single-stranded-DNA-specific exonuclease RecJ [Actinobacteria bacterium]|nr:single-stranded-DNA-specific exonuclease RecJ [Actinomycetota bacterium]